MPRCGFEECVEGSELVKYAYNIVGVERGSRVSQGQLYPRCDRVHAAHHAPRCPFCVLGPLTARAISQLRLVKKFLGVTFRLAQEEGVVRATCLGAGLRNASKGVS